MRSVFVAGSSARRTGIPTYVPPASRRANFGTKLSAPTRAPSPISTPIPTTLSTPMVTLRPTLGKVKLLMRGPYYVHGTPWPLSLGRATSHGCIRLLNEDAIALARLVQAAAGAVISAATTDSLAAALYDTRELELPRPVPFQIVYELAEVRGDTLALYPDVYGMARGAARAQVLGALARAGHDTSLVDRAVLRRLLARAARRPQAVWVDSLISLPAGPETTRMP
jgi:L,D-transpeptidase-like protein